MSQAMIASRYQPFAAQAPASPSHERILALSATLALNLGALLVLTLPLSAPSTHTPLVEKPIEVVDIRPPLPPPLIRQPARSEPASPPATPTLPVAPRVPAPEIEAIERTPAPSLLPLQPSIPQTTQAAGGESQGAVEGSDATGLQYISAPAPRYPAEAIRQGLQGTVWLRVLVDETGRPVEVGIEQGSGHRMLDEAARRQVLRRWRFQPALREGQAVPAWGRVPIDFRL